VSEALVFLRQVRDSETQSVTSGLTPKRKVARWNRAGGTTFYPPQLIQSRRVQFGEYSAAYWTCKRCVNQFEKSTDEKITALYRSLHID